MNRLTLTVLLSGLWITSLAAAQDLVLVASGPSAASLSSVMVPADDGSTPVSALIASPEPSLALAPGVTLPRMAPELALRAYERRSALQAAELVSYSATTVI